MIGRLIRAWGADDVAGPTEVQKTTFSDDRRQLYICLSELPSAGPAYIAVIEPDTGRFVRMLAVTLPVSPLRRDRFDPTGVIIPIKGAVHDKLVILDPDAGILSLYE